MYNLLNKNSSEEYNANSIHILSGLEPIRKNPAMYIGSIESEGLHQLVYEVIDNSIDEAIGGFCNTIDIIIDKNGVCSIEDNGRGIPVDHYPSIGLPACEVILTTLHSGGKFDGKAYYRSAGLHGVGVSCVNALSQKFVLEVYRDNKHYIQEYSRGKKVNELKMLGPTNKQGTKISFSPDGEVFSKTANISYEVLKKKIQELAFIYSGIRIRITDERTNQSDVFCYNTGIVGFVNHLSGTVAKVHPEIIHIKYEKNELEMEAALQWTVMYSENMKSYVNGINTVYGGTHVLALKKALIDCLNNYGIKEKLILDNVEQKLSAFDIFEGVIGVISLKMVNPRFEGQTKTKLTNKEIEEPLISHIYKDMMTLFSDNILLAKQIINRAMSAKNARIAARRAAENSRYQLNSNTEVSDEIYQQQFGIRSKNWHDSAVWLTNEELLQKHVEHLEVERDAKVLDVCCGSGVVGASFKGKVKSITGLDLTPEMVELSKQRLDEVYQGTVYNMPFSDQSYDLVVTREVLHLLQNPQKPVSEIYRVLKPGGQFIVGQIIPFSAEDGPWMYRVFKKKQPLIFNMFQENDFKSMLKAAGFVDMKTTEYNLWESIDVWINTYETTYLHREEIKELFLNAPKEIKKYHPYKILPSGEIQDLWRWMIFSVRKPF